MADVISFRYMREAINRLQMLLASSACQRPAGAVAGDYTKWRISPEPGIGNMSAPQPLVRLYIHTYAHLFVFRLVIIRLYSVKTNIFQNAFFWYFFIKNDLSRVDLIIKMVLEFLSNL